MGDLRQAEGLQQRGKVHPEPAAVTAAQAVPAPDGVVGGPAPRLDRTLGGSIMRLPG